jgi:hypothetical protein
MTELMVYVTISDPRGDGTVPPFEFSGQIRNLEFSPRRDGAILLEHDFEENREWHSSRRLFICRPDSNDKYRIVAADGRTLFFWPPKF